MRGLQEVTEAVERDLLQIVADTARSEEMRLLCALAVERGPRGMTVRRLACILQVHETSLNSRFYRVGAPSPRRLLVDARLVLVAELRFEGYLGREIAEWCGFSSPQALGRHVRQERGMTLVALGLYPRAELDRFRAMLTLAHWPECPLTGSRTGVAA